MRRRFRLAGVLLLGFGMTAAAQITGDVIGMHDLSPGSTSPIQGARPGSCTYCHVPHSGNGNLAPLWNQKLSTATYTTYTSTTYNQKNNQQPPLGTDSGLCLSCHDGTVAPGDSVLYGQIQTTGSMYDPDKFGAQLQSSHPFSLVKPLQDDIDLFSGVVQGKTADKTGAVQLIQGNVECTSCHNPHIQAVDKLSMNFLVKDSSSAQLCLSCHDPARTSVSGNIQVNPLAGWAVGIHAIATNKISAQAKLGSYGTVGADGCISCHLPHNAQGPARLLRGQNEQACIGCHSGGSNLSPAAPNVFAEFGKVGHPFPNGTNQHDAAESAVLNNNRHATCADCHNSHGAEQVTIFNAPPLLRVSQANTSGVKIDGTSVINPAINEYEPCLRCHGYSAGKVSNPIYGYMPGRASADPLNLITQMNLSAKSSHPVMHIRNSTSVSQPSLLLTMLDFDGTTTKGRSMGQQIFCSDCHNSDDNREFGGSGANGPHGSKWLHILERDYEFSQAPGGPGTPITININKQPNLTVNGPYGMCAKCHDLNVVIGATSWANHGNHVRDDGFSCSVCHSPHGMTAGAGNPTGVRMVDFDTKVVGSNSGQNISYNQGANTCVLVCHSVAHDAQGHVKAVSTNGPAKK